MTNAERQRKHRQKRKQKGIVKIPVEVTEEGAEFLRECYEDAMNPGNTLGEFYEKCLIRGAAFTANTSKGSGKRGVPAGALRSSVRRNKCVSKS